FLQHHLHVPGPDPLTNADTEGRQQSYGDLVEGTPIVLVNGKRTQSLGGFKQEGQDRFEKLSRLLNEQLEKEPGARLRLAGERAGDRLDLTANLSELKQTGDKVRLRFVLGEEVVRYAGRNGQRLHRHVVRCYPGGVEGIALRKPSDKHSVQ